MSRMLNENDTPKSSEDTVESVPADNATSADDCSCDKLRDPILSDKKASCSSDSVNSSHKNDDTKVTPPLEISEISTGIGAIERATTSESEKKCTKKEDDQQNSTNTDKSDRAAVSKIVLLQRVSEKLHSPFYWQADLNIRNYIDQDMDLPTDFGEMYQGTSFKFRRFVVHAIMCYHNFSKSLTDQAKKNQEEMESMLCFSAKRESHDVVFNSIKDALFHISHSCRVYILERTNQIEKAYQILKKITPYELMNNANKAGIWAIRAAVYAEYGYEGVKKAIEYIGKAVEFDKKNAYWHFFKGIYLGRLRRMEKGPIVPKEEEVYCLETAMAKHQDPAFYAFTAEVYVETWKAIENLQKRNKLPISDLRTKDKLSQHLDKCKSMAAQYFEESVRMKSNCAHLLFRCGKGLMKLTSPYQDLDKAKKWLEEGLDISPQSSFGNHAMAIFMLKYEKDIKSAKKYLEKAMKYGNFQAHMDYCRLRYLESQENEGVLITELTEMVQLYTDIPKSCKLHGELIICHLFLIYNLEEACICATNLVQLQSKLRTSSDDYIFEFCSGLFPFSAAVPLIEVLVSEIGNQFASKNIKEQAKSTYKKFLSLILTEVGSRLPNNPQKDLLSVYMNDLKEGLRRERDFLKSRRKENENQPKEKHRQRSSSRRARREHDETSRQRDRRSPLRKESDQPSKRKGNSRSVSRRDESKLLTKDFAALAIDEAAGSRTKTKLRIPTGEISVTEKINAFLSKSKTMGSNISYSVGPREKTSSQEIPECERKAMSRKPNRDSSSSVERKSARSTRSRKNDRSTHVERRSTKNSRHRKYRDTSSSSDRKSAHSRRQKKEFRSPSSARNSTRSNRDVKRRDHSSSRSPDRISVRSFNRKKSGEHRRSSSPDRSSRKHRHHRNRERDYSSRRSSRSRYRKRESKRSHSHQSESDESRRGRDDHRAQSRRGSDAESCYSRRHRDNRRRERSHSSHRSRYDDSQRERPESLKPKESHTRREPSEGRNKKEDPR